MDNNKKNNYDSMLNAKSQEELQNNLFQHFLYLADTPGFEPVLKAICEKAKNASVQEDNLHIDFGNELILSAEPPGNIADYSEWPLSFQKCMAIHKSLEFPEKGWSVFLGKHYTFEADYLEEDKSDLRDYVAEEDVLSPLADYSDWWLYHPGHKNAQGEPVLAYLSHEEDSIEKPVLYNIGALFLKRMSEILEIDVEIPQIYKVKINIEEAFSWWNILSKDWQTALKKSCDIDSTEMTEKDLLEICHLTEFHSSAKGVDLSDLTPLSFLCELEIVSISNQKMLTDFSSIKSLCGLKKLRLVNGSVFRTLPLDNMEPADLSFLENMKNLKSLTLRNMPLKNVEAVKKFPALENLSLSSTDLKNISFVAENRNLKTINCIDTQIDSIDALQNLIYLEDIIISKTNIYDLSPLDNLKKITLLRCDRTKVSFESIISFVDAHTDIYYNSTDCEITYDDLNDESDFIKAVKKADFPLKNYSLGFTSLTDWKLLSLIMRKDYQTAVTLLKLYLKNLPERKNHILEEKLFDDCVVLMTKVDDKSLEQEIFTKLFPAKIEKAQTAFNLACYSALKKDKKNLLKYTELALNLGQWKRSFTTDDDFADFQNDTDFLALLNIEKAEISDEEKLLKSLFGESALDEAPKEKIEMLDLNYFKAPIADSYYEKYEACKCSICGARDTLLHKADASIELIHNEDISPQYLCIECLRNKKYAFAQEVEGGFITKDGIVTQSEKYKYLKSSSTYTTETLPLEEKLLTIDKNKIEDLKYTPPFRAWQGAYWLTCCADFMTFIGTWVHDDFVKFSPDGNAKKFFQKICDKADELIYDGDKSGDGFYDAEFGPDCSEFAESTFYAFQCPHCKKYRGYVDNP